MSILLQKIFQIIYKALKIFTLAGLFMEYARIFKTDGSLTQ